MTEKITSKQENRLCDLFRDALRSLDLKKDEAQKELIANGGAVQSAIKETLKKFLVKDPRFGPAITEFKLTVPTDYNHDTWLATFAEKTKGAPNTYHYNNDLTDANFSKASNRLVPGKAYTVKNFPILETVSSEDCMAFLKKQGAILVGAQGLMLLQHLNKDVFPMSKWTVSFDEKNALWQDAGGSRRVPIVNRGSDGGWRFDLGYFEIKWHDHICLLCVCD